MLVLGIETSCDDTAAAILDDNAVLSNILSGQETIHTPFGGVVPELASRKHLQAIHPVVDSALKHAAVDLAEVDLISVTRGPGLIGSLLIGFSYAKALAMVSGIPLVGVDHLAGHILSVFLEENSPAFPYLALIASGGTTSIFLARGFTEFECLGRTRDDAAGEAFDKVAKLLSLPYPGGPHISSLAQAGDPQSIKFPRAWLDKDAYDFSFSGLKTAVLNYVNKSSQTAGPLWLEDICASFEEAVIEVLVEKSIKAAVHHGIDRIVVGGGVSANGRLRNRFVTRCTQEGLHFFCPKPVYSTDNGAMIAYAGSRMYERFGSLSFDEDVFSRSNLG